MPLAPPLDQRSCCQLPTRLLASARLTSTHGSTSALRYTVPVWGAPSHPAANGLGPLTSVRGSTAAEAVAGAVAAATSKAARSVLRAEAASIMPSFLERPPPFPRRRSALALPYPRPPNPARANARARRLAISSGTAPALRHQFESSTGSISRLGSCAPSRCCRRIGRPSSGGTAYRVVASGPQRIRRPEWTPARAPADRASTPAFPGRKRERARRREFRRRASRDFLAGRGARAQAGGRLMTSATVGLAASGRCRPVATSAL